MQVVLSMLSVNAALFIGYVVSCLVQNADFSNKSRTGFVVQTELKECNATFCCSASAPYGPAKMIGK
jgi:hypothetical protein